MYVRPSAEYRTVLLNALRYPWAPAAQHAADAIVKLNLQDAVPDLLSMLNEPDPRALFVVKKVGEQPKTMVRELVRVNHHRNCMLCHVPIAELPREMTRVRVPEIPMGPVPSPQDRLPPSSSAVYYGFEPGITVVRADVTYLRQDFSVKQKVEKNGKWPELQRFDFFVRTVELTEKEAATRKPAPGLSEYHSTIVAALYGLTGQTQNVVAADLKRETDAGRIPGNAKSSGLR